MSSIVRVNKRTISPIQVLKNRNMMTGINLVEQVQSNNFKMNRNILTKSVQKGMKKEKVKVRASAGGSPSRSPVKNNKIYF